MDKLKIQDIIDILEAKKHLANAQKMWNFHWDDDDYDEWYHSGKANAYKDCIQTLKRALEEDEK